MYSYKFEVFDVYIIMPNIHKGKFKLKYTSLIGLLSSVTPNPKK